MFGTKREARERRRRQGRSEKKRGEEEKKKEEKQKSAVTRVARRTSRPPYGDKARPVRSVEGTYVSRRAGRADRAYSRGTAR